jgi:hypothetical protein
MSELKPCPFCGIASNDINDHLIDCWIRWVVAGDNSDLDIEDAYDPRPLEDALRAELARRDEIITRLKEDAERLASTYVIEVFPHEWVCRGGCHHWARFGEQIDHAPDCPVALHRALMNELEEG